MAIISCPDCDKNISSHSKACPYCGFQRNAVAEEKLRELRRRKLRDRIYHLKMTSYAALALLVAAFGWSLLDTASFQYRPSTVGPYLMFTLGALSYLVVRLYLYKFKAALRKLGL